MQKKIADYSKEVEAAAAELKSGDIVEVGKSHKATMGKWFQDCLSALDSIVWLTLLIISYKSRLPVRHLQNWHKAKHAAFDLW